MGEGRSDGSTKDEQSGYVSIDGVVNDDPLGPLTAIPDDELLKRFSKMLTSVSDGPVPSGERGIAIGGTAFVKHCVRVKTTINNIYDTLGVRICRSPERPDLHLFMEEAYGRCVVDLIVGPTELLPAELRQIGKNVDNYTSREKRSHDNAKEKAKDKRKNACSAACNNEAKAAALDDTLAAIESDLEAKRAERLAQPAALNLPDPKMVVVDGPAPVHWRKKAAEKEAAEAEAREAEEAAAEFEAEADAADAIFNAAAVKLERRLERASRALERLPGSERTAQQWLAYCCALGESKPSEAEQKRRDAVYERWFAARLKVAEHLGASEKAEREAARARRPAVSSAQLAKAAREACEAKAACEQSEAKATEPQQRLTS